MSLMSQVSPLQIEFLSQKQCYVEFYSCEWGIMQIWWWKALVSMSFVMANTHFGREKWTGWQCPKNQGRSALCPALPPFLDMLLCFKIAIFVYLRTDILWARRLTQWGESGFPQAHILTSVSVRKKIAEDIEEEVTHAFGGKCLSEVSLTLALALIFLSIMILLKNAYYNGKVYKCIALLKSNFSSLCLILYHNIFYIEC